jgi:hypothetical protein
VLQVETLQHRRELSDRQGIGNIEGRETKRRLDIFGIAGEGPGHVPGQLEVLFLHGLQFPIPGFVAEQYADNPGRNGYEQKEQCQQHMT